jgi:hypothetical protein
LCSQSIEHLEQQLKVMELEEKLAEKRARMERAQVAAKVEKEKMEAEAAAATLQRAEVEARRR